jgi:predicted MFS family arabinose efflux permease
MSEPRTTELPPLPEPPEAAELPELPAKPASVAADLKALLGDSRFRLLLSANFASTIGEWLAFMALFSLTSFEWNRGVGGVAILGIAYMLPVATLSPVAGVWLDRLDLRRTLVTSALLRGTLILGMALWPHFWITCVLLCLHQAVSCFFNPAQHSALARLVKREHLLAANALNAQAAQLTKILGPGVAGVLVAWLGPRGCFELNAVMMLVAGLFLSRLPRLPGLGRGRTSFAGEFRRGLGFLRHAPRLRGVVLLLMLGLCALGGFIAAMPIYARDTLGTGPRGLGLLLSGMGGGAALGAFAVAHAGKRWDKTWSITFGAWLGAGALWIVAHTSRADVSILGTAMLGWGVAFLLVPAYALLQEETPHDLLGRVLSLAIAALSLAQVLGMGLAGSAATRMTPQRLLQVEAILLALAACVFLFWTFRRRVPLDRDTCGFPATK